MRVEVRPNILDLYHNLVDLFLQVDPLLDHLGINDRVIQELAARAGLFDESSVDGGGDGSIHR
jgi:hypothetical protein